MPTLKRGIKKEGLLHHVGEGERWGKKENKGKSLLFFRRDGLKG